MSETSTCIYTEGLQVGLISKYWDMILVEIQNIYDVIWYNFQKMLAHVGPSLRMTI